MFDGHCCHTAHMILSFSAFTTKIKTAARKSSKSGLKGKTGFIISTHEKSDDG